jgi:predicted transcriptional regulator
MVKTAVSLPDELFRQAEMIAKRLCVSRSRLYAQALEHFLTRSTSESVTDQLNAVYSEARVEVDPGLQRTQTKVLQQGPW